MVVQVLSEMLRASWNCVQVNCFRAGFSDICFQIRRINGASGEASDEGLDYPKPWMLFDYSFLQLFLPRFQSHRDRDKLLCP